MSTNGRHGRSSELDRLRLAAIVESSDDAIISKDLDGIVTSWNRGAERMLGYTAQEMVGRSITILAPQGLEDDMPCILARIQRGELVNHYETRRRRKDGTVIDVSLTVSPVRDALGTIIGASKIARDITERKRDEAKLRELATALDLAPTFVRDVDGTIRFWGTGVRELYGYERSEAVGRISHDLLRTEFPEPLGDIQARLLTNGQWRGELRHHRRDGATVIVASTWTLQRNADGTPRAVVEVNNDITEIRQAELDRLRLAAIVESSNDAIIAKDLNGIITSWNPAAERMLGYRADEMLGRPITVLAPPGLEDDMPRILAQIRRGELVERYETRRRRKDGVVIDVSLTVSPIRNASGVIIGASKIARDITERRRIEEALQESEQRFRSVFEQAAVGIALVAPDGAWLRVNQRLCDILGYRQAELLRLTFQDITHPEDLQADLAHVQTLLAGESDSYQMEKRYRTASGGTVWAMLTVAVVRNKNDSPLYLISVIEDITQRKQGEEALRQSKERFRALLENSPRMMWVNRPDGSPEYFNAAWREYTGQVVLPHDMSLMDAVHPDDRAAYLQLRTKAIAAGVPFEGEYRLLHRNGLYRWHAFRVAPLTEDGKINAWVGTATDVDDFRRMTEVLEERVLERTRRLAEATAEMEAFSYSVAHDLRAPLRSMRGFSEALLEDYGDRLDKTGLDYAARILSGAERMDELINDLLAYSRLSRDDVRLEPVDLGTTLRHALDQLRSVVMERDAEVAIEGDLPVVMAQRSVLHQVVLNLVGNALKFVAAGTRPRVRIRAERREGTVRVTVEDNGIGFEPKHAERVFRVFERLHGAGSAYPGTGIGLAIVRKGIERLGGQTGVESEPDKGSRFWFELPLAET